MLIEEIKFKATLLETFHLANLRHPYFVWKDSSPFDSVVGKIMPPKHVHALLPGTRDYVRSQGKGQWGSWIELVLLIIWPWGVEIILDYLIGPNLVTRFFRSGRERQGERMCQGPISWEKPYRLLLSSKQKGAVLRNADSCENLEKERSQIHPERLQEGTQPHRHHNFSSLRPASDFWTTELEDNKCVFFSAIAFLVIYYSSNRKQTQARNHCRTKSLHGPYVLWASHMPHIPPSNGPGAALYPAL